MEGGSCFSNRLRAIVRFYLPFGAKSLEVPQRLRACLLPSQGTRAACLRCAALFGASASIPVACGRPHASLGAAYHRAHETWQHGRHRNIWLSLRPTIWRPAGVRRSGPQRRNGLQRRRPVPHRASPQASWPAAVRPSLALAGRPQRRCTAAANPRTPGPRRSTTGGSSPGCSPRRRPISSGERGPAHLRDWAVRFRRGLQPSVTEAATLCDGGCSLL